MATKLLSHHNNVHWFVHEKISDITFLICLGHPWQHNTEYIISISVTWPRQ